MSAADFRSYSESLLVEGALRLSMTMGVVSNIAEARYTIIAVVSSTDVFVPGESFALNDTYCRDVYRDGVTLALTEFGGQNGLKRHPLYENHFLESYISSPIRFNELIWGTVNFTSMQTRELPFSQGEIDFVESLAGKLSMKLSELEYA